MSWIAPDEHRLKIFHAADHRARFPLERRLTPAVKPWLVGLNLHQDPVPHLRVDDQGVDVCDFHRSVHGIEARASVHEQSGPCDVIRGVRAEEN